MPSPFPGMDPFIESQKWKGFHLSMISEIRNALTMQVRPRYVVDVEEDVYLAKEGGTPIKIVVPDVSVVPGAGWMEESDGSIATTLEPAILTLPMTEPIEIPYLAIRRSDNEETVAVIEVLSPTNKTSRDGRTEYLAKRNSLLRSRAHLIEIDLLRGGERLPTIESLPTGDYFAFVSRAERRPKAEVYAWGLERPMPCIPIPLSSGDPDANLDLQSVFATTYDRAGYDYAIHYDRSIEPPFDERSLAIVTKSLTSVRGL
jgi:hypothetical protein